MNPKFITIIAAVVSSASLAAVAEKTGMSNAALIGCVSAMKKAGLVEYADKTITLTEEGKKHLPVVEEKATAERNKYAESVVVLSREGVSSMKRADRKKLLMTEIGISDNCAHTYVYKFDAKMKEVNKPFMEMLFGFFAAEPALA